MLVRLGQLHDLVQAGQPELAEHAAPLLSALETDVRAFIDREETRLSERHQRVEEQTRQSLPVIGTAAALALVLTLALSLTAARSVTWPVARLREAAGHLLAGRYQSIAPEGPTELADLIVLFNHMALTLTHRADVLERQEERYRTYIGALAHILWT